MTETAKRHIAHKVLPLPHCKFSDYMVSMLNTANSSRKFPSVMIIIIGLRHCTYSIVYAGMQHNFSAVFQTDVRPRLDAGSTYSISMLLLPLLDSAVLN